MSRPCLADLFPDIDTVLELAPEELGAAILEQWQAHAGRGEKANLETFIERVYGVHSAANYPPTRHDAFVLALAEAWSWLCGENLIFEDPLQQPGQWYRRTRRGASLKTRTDVEAYRQASLLPRTLLHPKIDEKAWSAFQRGEYDVAVFQAFKAVEVAVRNAANLSADHFGPGLMRKAFDPENGPLKISILQKSESDSVAHLFAGAMGYVRNPLGHRDKPVRLEEAARLLMFASYLMETVEFHEILGG